MASIQYIKRNKLDVNKYDACIDKSTNRIIYAYSWYLDEVCDTWDVLIYGDYEAVFPVPYLRLKRHLYIKKIYQPDLTQQLGLFAENKLDIIVVQAFFKSFMELKPRHYHFNFFDSKHYFHKFSELNERINYELDLSKKYEEIASGYSTNLKRNLKKATKASLIVKGLDSEKFIRFKKENTHYATNKRQVDKMTALFQKAEQLDCIQFHGVFFEKQLIAAVAKLYEGQHRITLISGASNEVGRKYNAFAFLLDYLLQQYAASGTIYDFEGSMIPGVARFYKSFGAEQANYLSWDASS